MISVVLAAYNSEKYIKEQFDSILNQTISVDEVIIVDDCSSDNTVELIDKYIIANGLVSWKVYKHESNQGYIKTFKEGLGYANGDVIITCDHDDVWMMNKVEIIRNSFKKNNNILYLATSFVQIDENDNEISIKQKRNRSNNNLIRRCVNKGSLNKMSLEDVAIYNIAPGCTCALSSKLRDEYVLSKDTQLPHDWAMALMAAYMDGLYYLDVVTTKYRLYCENTIGLGHEGKYSKRLEIVEKNSLEKQAMLRIIERLNADGKVIEYFQSISKIFNKRVEYLKTKNLFKLLFLSVVSIPFGTLYESIIYDCLSMLIGDKNI